MSYGKLYPFRITTEALDKYRADIALGYLSEKVMAERLRETFFQVLQEVDERRRKPPYNKPLVDTLTKQKVEPSVPYKPITLSSETRTRKNPLEPLLKNEGDPDA